MRKQRPAPRVNVTVLSGHPASVTADLTTLQALERRLDDGYARIEEALARGEDVSTWESFWIDLLHLYEAEWDSLPEAA
jgi:hypothetical protein